MQEKMASRNRLVRAVASATSHVWFPLSLALARRLPRRLLRAMSRQTTMRFMQLRPKYQNALRANLAVILGRPAASRDVRSAARNLLDAHFTAWIDFLHFATRPPEEAARLVESVVGYSRIIQARARGNGVLLLTAHLGNWEIGGLMLAEMRQPIHVVLVPDIFPAVERARRALHERAGISEIRVDRSFAPTLAVLRALKSNAIVAMQGDRDFNNTGIAIPFFGREAYFPRGPLLIAMSTAATVLPAFIVRVADGRYRAIVERYVRENPEQWYCFYPFWEDPSRNPTPVS